VQAPDMYPRLHLSAVGEYLGMYESYWQKFWFSLFYSRYHGWHSNILTII